MITDNVRAAIKEHNLIRRGDKILVGVSGGPDSVALLYLLDSLRKELKITLHIAHLDHMLRKNSRKDAEFSEGLGQRLKIPVTIGQINVAALAKKGSLEEIARNARLGFLFKVAKDIKADKIALGHNLDDQAETVLMRILRGAGLYGLTAMQPVRKIGKFVIIRPLLETKRSRIEAFLRRKKIKPRFDVSNSSEIYLRNRVRSNLLPLLEKEYNANIKEVLANMAQNVGSDYNYLSVTAKRLMKGAKTKLNLEKLMKLHPAIRRLAIRHAIACVKGDMRSIGFQHMKEIEDLISNRPLNSIVDLPKGVSVIKKKSLSFYRR